jgi:hypothetical protein
MKGSKLTAGEIIKTTLLTILKGGEAAAHTGNAAAMEGEAVAGATLETVLVPLLIIVLALVAALAVLIGIGAGIVAIVKAISNAYNADAIAAKNAEQAAENLANAYNDAKSAYEDLK